MFATRSIAPWLLICLLVPAHAPAPACCPAGPRGKPVVNADQTVVILWDAARKTQHFIRQASFKSDSADLGFIIPTPAVPELEESGQEAFPLLARVTAPEIKRVRRPNPGLGCGCSAERAVAGKADSVNVLQEKTVAGFDAAVLEASTSEALVGWLEEHGYSFSPEIQTWAEPYIAENWKFTALKVTSDEAEADRQRLTAAALRLSFSTDRPLFPYREPDPRESAAALSATSRLLRIFFVADERYQGELTAEAPWTGKVAWSDRISSADRTNLLEALKLPATTGPETFWLTEFEDEWPYRAAPADLYFSPAKTQDTVKRPPQEVYVSAPFSADVALLVLAAALVLPILKRRKK